MCQAVVPDADRDLLGCLSLPRMQQLIQAFFDASPDTATTGEATDPATSGS